MYINNTETGSAERKAHIYIKKIERKVLQRDRYKFTYNRENRFVRETGTYLQYINSREIGFAASTYLHINREKGFTVNRYKFTYLTERTGFAER
jgi:hypothetical protein